MIVDFLKKISIRKFFILKLWWDQNDSFLYKSGWIRSFRSKKCVDNEGHAIPWLSNSLNHFLDERLRSDMVMYEYGSGYSTLYFAQRIAKVYTIEYNEAWFNWLADRLPRNVIATYKAVEDAEYVNNISSINESFDIVVIDGRRRNECIQASLTKLSANGVMIVDDTHRGKYEAGCKLIEEKGFKKLNFWGFSNGSIEQKCSTLYYRQDNCFGI